EQPEPFFALTESFFSLFALGEVAGNLEEPAQIAGFVAECRNDHAGPELRAVFTDAPALVFKAAGLRRHFEFVRRPARSDHLRWIELGEAPPDDLVGGVPLDPLCSGIPGDHVSLPIEQKNGIISDASNQFGELLLPIPRSIVGVARHRTINRRRRAVLENAAM